MTAAEESLERSRIRDLFTNAMSNAACTVSVVTTDGPAGRLGVTVSAMTSVSADTPRPTLLVCVHQMSPCAEAIIQNGVFCVNVLRDDQWSISDCFAGRYRTPDGNKFSCTEWAIDVNGAPRVENSLVAFSCKLASSQKIGTHYVFFGSVEEIVSTSSGSPLIYASRAYGTPVHIEAHQLNPVGPAEALKLGTYHSFGPYIVPQVIEAIASEGVTVDLKLLEGDQNQIVGALRAGTIDIALIYDLGIEVAAREKITIERLTALTPYVLLAESHPLARYPTLSLSDLAEWPLVLLDTPPSGDYFTSLFAEKGLQPNIGLRTRSVEMVRGFVAHGLGYSLLATKPASSMSYDGRALTTRTLQDEVRMSHLALATRAGRPCGRAAEMFAQRCRAVAAQIDPSGLRGPVINAVQ